MPETNTMRCENALHKYYIDKQEHFEQAEQDIIAFDATITIEQNILNKYRMRKKSIMYNTECQDCPTSGFCPRSVFPQI